MSAMETCEFVQQSVCKLHMHFVVAFMVRHQRSENVETTKKCSGRSCM